MRKNKIVGESNAFAILAVDDDEVMTVTLQSYFQASGYMVDIESDPVQAIERVRENHYDILLLDFLMRPICGDEVVKKIREFNPDIYIILLTGHKSIAPPIRTIRELDIQGYYEKSDRFDQLELLLESCVKSITQMRTIKNYQSELEQAYSSLHENYMEMVEAMRQVVDAKDIYTRGHSDRVSVYAGLIGEAMGKDKQYLERLKMAGLFHDIGKIGTSDFILDKDTPLTGDEYEAIKRHTTQGKQILLSISAFADIADIVEAHHEWVNGNGYPNGLMGEEIPEEARILCVADSFDAMTSYRKYRGAKSMAEAIAELKLGKGSQFDPAIVDVFIAILNDYESLKDKITWSFDDNTA